MTEPSETVSKVRGRTLTGVRYLVMPESSDAAERPSRSVDEVEHAVELTFEGHVMTASWCMDNEMECLSTSAGDVSGLARDYTKVIDMSDRPQWAGYIGKSVTSMRAAVHTPPFGTAECSWALSLIFDGEVSITVALGEVVSEYPTYLPDSLVVLFGQKTAEQYSAGDGVASSWGHLL